MAPSSSITLVTSFLSSRRVASGDPSSGVSELSAFSGPTSDTPRRHANNPNYELVFTGTTKDQPLIIRSECNHASAIFVLHTQPPQPPAHIARVFLLLRRRKRLRRMREPERVKERPIEQHEIHLKKPSSTVVTDLNSS
ncbi:hypothetical protein ACLB2K_035860 [Fragaria x ananassa]